MDTNLRTLDVPPSLHHLNQVPKRLTESHVPEQPYLPPLVFAPTVSFRAKARRAASLP